MASSSSNQEPETHLLSVGKQCSHSTCLLVDFLPFKCHHCSESFCQEHFKVDAHECPKYDESKHNRVAPNCPLCNTPVAVRPGQDPNVRMDLHLEKECSVVVGKTTNKSTPRCTRSSCNKVLFAPIRCDQCKQQFCPAHRFPADHTCNAPRMTPASKRTTTRPLANLNAGAKSLNVQASAAGTAALGAVKKTLSATSTTAGRTTPAAASSSKPPLPFSKTDRRAKAERVSRLKAMQERAKKGLLSEEEKVILAAEEAQAREKKDCIIM